jgi:phosphoglycolate phosphatase
MNSWKYILWDWNGTILDDFDYNYDIINALLATRNLPPISIEKYRTVFCFPIKEFYRKIGFNCEPTEYYKLVADYQQAYEADLNKIKMTKGIYETIKMIHSLKIKQIIFSSCNKLTIQHQLPLYDDLALYIDEIVAQDNDLAVGKESLAISWGEKIGINWKEVLVIGDTYYDQEVANNLGCECILISSGHQNVKKQKNIHICDAAFEIFDIIKHHCC